MKIVVDIKDDDYYDIIGGALIGEFTMMEVISAVKNGTPLPKGHGRKFEKIVVEYPPAELCTYPEYRGKPYFSIKYEENGEHIIGFGTYNQEVLSRYLLEYFIVSMIIEADKAESKKYCDHNICVLNEYNGIGCDDCEVAKSRELQEREDKKDERKEI